jgi:peptide maturation system protein (TIGR04066 family)
MNMILKCREDLIMPKRLSMFPMTRDLCAAARYPSLLQGYVFADLLIPGYTGLGGQDISRIDGGSFANTPLMAYEPALLANCDTLLVDYEENMTSTTAYQEVITQAQDAGKEVILSRKLVNQLHTGPVSWPDGLPTKPQNVGDRLYEIRVPVITVLSQGPRTDTFAVELALRKHFVSAGYTVSQIGSHVAGTVFGFNPLPNFLYEPRDAYEKTLAFNRFAKNLTLTEKPHLLILGVEDSIMKYNDQLLFGMGFVPYIVCQAVRSDETILCMYNGCNKDYLDEMTRYGALHLNSHIAFYNLSSTGFKPDFYGDSPKWNYVEFSSEHIVESFEKTNFGEYSVFNAHNSISIQNACMTIQKKLEGNASAMK